MVPLSFYSYSSGHLDLATVAQVEHKDWLPLALFKNWFFYYLLAVWCVLVLVLWLCSKIGSSTTGRFLQNRCERDLWLCSKIGSSTTSKVLG